MSLLVVFAGLRFDYSFATVALNDAFLLEGTGYAITKDIVKNSEINLSLYTHEQSGSNIISSIETGFITPGDENFLIAELKATMLREGKYVRINGIIPGNNNEEASVSFLEDR